MTDMINKKDLAKTICELRKAHNYSQVDIGKLLNVTDSLVSKWENGCCDIDIQYLERFRIIFNIDSIDELLTYQKKKKEELKKKLDEEKKQQQEKNAIIREKLKAGGFCCKAYWDKFSRDTRILTEYDGKKLTIHQNENPNISLYGSCVSIRVGFKAKCSMLRNGQWEDCCMFEDETDVWQIPFDFKNQISRIKFSFEESWIDDYEIEVVFVPADEKIWEAKQRQEQREALIKRMDIKTFSGYENAPTNILFRPANEDFHHAIIELYYDFDTGNRNNNDYELLKTYSLPDGELFWTTREIHPYRKFAFVIKQYDQNDNLIVESDKIKVFFL